MRGHLSFFGVLYRSKGVVDDFSLFFPKDKRKGEVEAGSSISRYSSSMKLPINFQKFLPEYSENQKWTAQNMLRPLAFRNFLSKIFRKPKMCYAEYATPLIRLLSQPPSPRGEGLKQGDYFCFVLR